MSYSPEWTAAPAILGAALVLLIVPPFALIALAVVALAAIAALAAALIALPYLLVRTVRAHLGGRMAGTPAIPVLTHLTPAGRPR